MRWVIFIHLLLILNLCQAQSNIATINLQLSFPQGAYKKTYPLTASGLILGIMHATENQPGFYFGGEFGILQVSGNNQYYTGNYNNEYNTFLVASWNHVITFSGMMKINLIPDGEFFQPFIDIRLGTNLFWTKTSISRDLPRDPITNVSEVKYYYSNSNTSWTLRIGSGVGVDFPFGHKKKFAAILKASYLFGSQATYYTHPLIKNFQITTFPRFSNTSMILLETGIRFNIFNSGN
ncbi:hypothetical protein BH11BAC3_BH11BAC3_19050 [soil metagenome]